ncbi:MAG: hypothetical protein ACRCW9_03905 [Cetobacterium sp.]
MQIGQEQLMKAVNKTGSIISNGSVVFILEAQGNRPKAVLTKLTDHLKDYVIGMATEDLGINEYGFICINGIVRGLNTQGITEGTKIYASVTEGQYSTTPPIDGYKKWCLGCVIKEHVSDGWVLIHPNEEIYMFGDLVNQNYSSFETNGFFKSIGVTCWDDLPPNPIIKSRQPATNNPTLATFKSNIQQYTFAVNDYVSDNLEILHWVKEGSVLKPHIHWATNGINVDNRYVKWELEYTIANGGGVEAFPNSTLISAETLIPANTADRTHFITGFPDISIPALKIGAILCYNIKRIASTGTAPTSNPFGLQVSSHCTVDSLGSRGLFTK